MVCGSVCGHRDKIGRKLAGKRSGGWKSCCQGPDVRADGRMSGPGRMSGLGIRRTPRGEVKSGAKFGRFCGWNLGKRWGKARSSCNIRNPRIKSNKTSSHQQITKKNWGYFWWGFSDLGRKQQNQARKRGVGAPKRDQRGS